MSDIEKMYENCGIYPDCKARECGLDYCANSSGCGYAVYPDFTAEKQIELIKWLIHKYKTISIEHQLNLFYINIRDIYTGMVHIEFDETIAGLINNLWQSLTEEEKQQVKGILE
jgi:hypothetical protein